MDAETTVVDKTKDDNHDSGCFAQHYESLESLLTARLPDSELQSVRRLLYGENCGMNVAERRLEIPRELVEAAAQDGIDVQGFRFVAGKEEVAASKMKMFGTGRRTKMREREESSR